MKTTIKWPKILLSTATVQSHLSQLVESNCHLLQQSTIMASNAFDLPSNFQLRTCDNDPQRTTTNGKSGRPLVLLYSWFLAKDFHLEKYRNFWTSRGYDILTIRTRPIDMIAPSWAMSGSAIKIREFVAKYQPNYLLVHGFCGGNFQFMELLNQLLMIEADRYDSEDDDMVTLRSIKCFIADSITTMEDTPEGIGKVLTKNRMLQLLIKGLVLTYIRLTHSFVMKRFIKLEQLLKENPKRLSTLIFYSTDDHISSLEQTTQLIEGWKSRQLDVRIKCWKSSHHVRHYRLHKEEYVYEVETFLKELQL